MFKYLNNHTTPIKTHWSEHWRYRFRSQAWVTFILNWCWGRSRLNTINTVVWVLFQWWQHLRGKGCSWAKSGPLRQTTYTASAEQLLFLSVQTGFLAGELYKWKPKLLGFAQGPGACCMRTLRCPPLRAYIQRTGDSTAPVFLRVTSATPRHGAMAHWQPAAYLFLPMPIFPKLRKEK